MDAENTSILDFIGGKNVSFIIPAFQRNFEWTDVQCSELYEDLKEAYQKQKNHYLGNIVYYKAKSSASFKEYVLIDGQQRFTSIMLLLAAIRDLLGEDEQKLKNNINYDYLKHDENKLPDNEIEYRIRLKQESSNDYCEFTKIVDNLEIDENSNSKIITNYLFFKNAIASDLKNGVISSLRGLYDSIERLEIVKVDLQIEESNLESVQLIFEKINSTGKPLTFSDLVRNFLLISSDTKKQRKLFENYWKIIENDLGVELLEQFMSCFLTYKTKEEIRAEDKYKKFKEFFKTHDKESLLKELLNLEPFYKLFKEFETKDRKIKKSLDLHLIQYLKMLSKLKARDIEPLLLQIYPTLYESNKTELKNIIRLFVDYMIRYRIVSPSKGGKALATTTLNLLNGLTKAQDAPGFIETTYDDILQALSNSQTEEGRFPTDDEFKEALMNSSLNMTYARVCLVRIEDYETKNIPVSIDSITVEHLLPQTKTSWWVRYLGGEENYIKIYNKYLNCIGNLTPISSSYNSSVSNNPWQDKIDSFQNVQFRVTNEIAQKYPTWREENIIARNTDIAERACLAVTSPLERTDQLRKESDKSLEDKISFSDLERELENSSVTSFLYDDEQYELNSWRDLLNIVCSKMYQLDSVKFKQLVDDNLIHKSTHKKVDIGKDPIISSDKTKLNEPQQILCSDYFVEVNLSSKRVRVYCKQILDFYGVTDRCSYSVCS